MKTAIICGRWEMEFEEHIPSSLSGFKEPFLDRVLGTRWKDVSFSTAGGYALLKDLPTGLSFVEFFGGVGIQSTIIRSLRPKRHVIIEKDHECVLHLKRHFKKDDVIIVEGDAYEEIDSWVADAYLLDSNNWTINQWPEHRQYWETLFATQPQYLTFYDTCKPYFHINKGLYGRLLSRDLHSLHDYSVGLSDYFYSNYGYGVARAVYCPRAIYYLLARGKHFLQEVTISQEEEGLTWKL